MIFGNMKEKRAYYTRLMFTDVEVHAKEDGGYTEPENTDYHSLLPEVRRFKQSEHSSLLLHLNIPARIRRYLTAILSMHTSVFVAQRVTSRVRLACAATVQCCKETVLQRRSLSLPRFECLARNNQ